ncbi:MAG TPA: transcriptional regulator, partial [Sphaerochaeta sp.]|nr:transcriptional regulator [Sphaerochaeta sp.]
MDLDTRSVDAIKRGYRFDETSRTYTCDLCGA